MHYKDKKSSDDRPLLPPTEESSEAEPAATCCTLSAKSKQELFVGALVAGVLACGGFNRVAAKIMSVPMGNFSFFLGTFNGLFYTVFYLTVLFVRCQWGPVPFAQFHFPLTFTYPPRLDDGFLRSRWRRISPWKWFLLMGLNDGLGNVLGLLAQPYVSGTMSALVSQVIVLFSMICALVMLRTRYTYWQVWSVFLVLSGVIVTVLPAFMGDSSGSDPFFSIVMMFSTLPNAISFTLKEMMFQEHPNLDVFVVSSYASLFQLLLQPVFLPLTLLFNQTGGLPFLDYIRDGFMCFVGKTPAVSHNNCTPDPYPYLIYIGINICYNVLLLLITKNASALLSFMAIKAVLPISIVLFIINWPLIGSATLSLYTVGGLVVVLVGLIFFRFTTIIKKEYNLPCCSCWLPCGNEHAIMIVNEQP